MDKALEKLIKISNTVGKDSSLVQGGGGNTSVKTDDGRYMYIKVSGTALKDMNRNAGWRRMRLKAVLSIIKDDSLARLDTNTREVEVVNRLGLCCDDKFESGSRPSVEAPLHSALDKYVVHLHPDSVGAYVNAKNGKVMLEKLFAGEKYPPLWVPYYDPGFSLARKITKLVDDYKKTYRRIPAVMFLEKHGLFVTANSSAKVLSLVRKVIKITGSKLKQPRHIKGKPPATKNVNSAKLIIRKAFFEATGRYTAVSFFTDDSIAAFSSDRNASKMLAAAALAPDEMVYANGPAMWIDKCDSAKIAKGLRTQIARGQKPSSAFLVKGLGLFVVGKISAALTIRDIAASSFFVRYNACRMGGINSLNKRQQEFVNNWEAEAFRKSLVSGDDSGQLKERIAVVTGAGSGLGRSIAIGLARAGAIVGIADIDTKAAQQTAKTIEAELSGVQALVIECNVTDENSIEEAIAKLIDNFGGIDILVNAAGLAPAYPLVELPVDKWRSALEVNLTGYFLMAKAAARVMTEQEMGGNIINISSKSGLEASKNNTAYNATKAGELHMARGWAMELGQYGIRVNCVCPGNVFEGSKIWNPEYIKVCAKKYGIKPEEVIPYYVNKTSLKREIKGQDVADVVVFLCSDKARTITGQIIVADSGQVMVR